MEQLIEFAGNHSLLVIAFFAILGMLAYHTAVGGGKNNIPPLQATQLINHEEAVVVDVRPIADFNKGHIVNAINIPINGFKNQIKQLEKHKDKPVIISCRSGSQSQAACRDLRKSGFEQTYNLRGGIMAWQSANLPLSKER
ncbi:MAG: rhodanese-like domain-containing protein [Pseudomonadota bacterium]